MVAASTGRGRCPPLEHHSIFTTVKNHAIAAAAVLLALFTVLGDRLALLLRFAWHLATASDPAPTQAPSQPAPAARVLAPLGPSPRRR